MNADIIYEILKHLYLFSDERENSAFVAKKIIFAQKSYREIEKRKIDKPIILRGCNNYIYFISKLDIESSVYWPDGARTIISKNGRKLFYSSKPKRRIKYIGDEYQIPDQLEFSGTIAYMCPENDGGIIRIFDHQTGFKHPYGISKITSIGGIKDLSSQFSSTDTKLVHKIGRYWDTSDVINMNHIFSNNDCLGKVGKYWNFSNVADMSYMFYRCKKLHPSIGKNWDTSNVQNMSYMFYRCVKLPNSIGKKWNTSNVKNMSHMFSHCEDLNQNIGKNWDTSSVEDMSYMFSGCRNLTKTSVISWNISGVKNMEGMFCSCRSLSRPKFKEWDLSHVENKKNIFFGCKK